MSDLDFGSDPIDKFTVPIDTVKTHLAIIFTMQVRENPQKRGRALAVVWDKRKPLIEEFENQYSYTVTFKEKGNVAGNHFHKKKKEIFFPLLGKFTVVLEDIQTKEREEHQLDSESHQAMYVPFPVAHAVRNDTDFGILFVVASSPNIEGDEYEYKLI